MTKRRPSLDDKYDLDIEHVLLNGSQAIVRLMLMQRERDRRAGLNTAGYITGYRGSPIAGLEGQFRRAEGFTRKANIVFRPGLNEDLAATALWGTQQAELRGEGRYDGVFGVWYGKGPGVDRSGDAFRHANHAGTSRHGGVLALMGDDHTCESSTTAHQSEWAFIDFMIPVINPAGVQEMIDYGLHGFALSRYAGVWVGLKCVKDNFESTSVVAAGLDRIRPVLPEDFALPKGGLNIRLHDHPVVREARLHDYKRDAAAAYARANRLDRVVFRGGQTPRLGIVTTGKSYLDTRQALEELGIDEKRAADLGLALYKVAMVWPFEPKGFLDFARDLDLLMVIEEKRMIIEVEAKEELYHLARRPAVVGKRDEQGETLFPAKGALEPTMIAVEIGERLLRFADDSALRERVARLKAVRAARPEGGEIASRIPYFCAGCPHNSSTVVPAGAHAYAGIGCHYMAQWMDRSTEGFTQMGGEGANWIGEAPFSSRDHVFQNLGDGTYIHSGSLAVRAAIASGVNITYKILYNDAVAMTGGQPLDGGHTLYQIATEMASEGAKRVVVVSDQPERIVKSDLPPGTTVHHRDELIAVQKELAEIKGVTVLIYEQTCAAEKRRRRKRGILADPPKRVFINTEVCEGCGDCGVQSNCVAIQPVETALGRKRMIDQSACNKDYSCLKGFCPSFVTVEGGGLRKPDRGDIAQALGKLTSGLPEPTLPDLERSYEVLITGVGGTGVVTISAVLGEAAFIDGKAFGGIDMTGLAQKGGSVACHTRFARSPDQIHSIRAGIEGADLVLGCDLVVSASNKVLETIRPGHTAAVVNMHDAVTGEFTRNPDLRLPQRRMMNAIEQRIGAGGHSTFIDANDYGVRLFGDTIAANMLLLGLAYQKGLVPVGAEAIEQAIGLNGVAVRMNTSAFRVGRLLAVDRAAVDRLAKREAAPKQTTEAAATPGLDELKGDRARRLTAYQDARWAARYLAGVEAIAAAERERAPGRSGLAETAAQGLYKLMSYKDEYEVARLHVDPAFRRALAEQFEGDFRLAYHLAPSLFAAVDPETGRPRKVRYGGWMTAVFHVLASLKGLRGTAFDIFGRSPERRAERAAIARYEALLAEIAGKLTPANHAVAQRCWRFPCRSRASVR
ncbi:MAG: indolepyruvate ferredoxin oxidoreductase family protein [Hyphomicrobiaceae bacterium]